MLQRRIEQVHSASKVLFKTGERERGERDEGERYHQMRKRVNDEGMGKRDSRERKERENTDLERESKKQ